VSNIRDTEWIVIHHAKEPDPETGGLFDGGACVPASAQHIELRFPSGQIARFRQLDGRWYSEVTALEDDDPE
jgi:hypothetical protein